MFTKTILAVATAAVLSAGAIAATTSAADAHYSTGYYETKVVSVPKYICKTFYQSVDGLSICLIDQFAYPENMEQAAYFKEMSDSLERSPWTTAVPIPVGDMLLLNNHFWLHGRSAFQRHHELYREVLRQRGTFSA